ncbi:MAG: cobalamin-binding protein [bacterium]
MKIPVTAILLLSLLASCSGKKEAYPFKGKIITDDFGNSIILKNPPHRIVSLAPNITEILFAVGADSSLVGVTQFCDYPPAAKTKTVVGGLLNPNHESIVNLKPDLVLLTTSGNLKNDFEKLHGLGIPVFASNPRTIEGVYKSIADIGKLTNRTSAADSLRRFLQARIQTLCEKALAHPPKQVLILLSLNPIVAAGRGTFLNELLETANGRNIVQGTSIAYPTLSREEILKRHPDVILVSSDVAKKPMEIMRAYPEWGSMPAIRNNRIHIVDANIVSRPGPRIALALESIIAAIHGD